jgi:hypothetical protein
MKFYGPHGTSKEHLASGAPVPEGDYFELTKSEVEDPHNLRLIQEGKVLTASDAAEKAVKEAATKAEKESAPENQEGGD